jgi:putative effector of murein hydrolase LrgA (UPF0299 family)
VTFNGSRIAIRMTPAAHSHGSPKKVFNSGAGASNRLQTGVWIALVAFACYLLFPNREFYWDGVGFALAIESPQSPWSALLYPNHLVYNLAGFLAWKATAALGLEWRALFVLQMMNALFAAGGVLLVWQILTGLTGPARHSLWGAILFAGSSQWWRFATDADAYIPSVFFLLLTYRLLFSAPRPRPFAAGVAQGAAMVFHQLALLFLPAAIAGILAQRHSDERSDAGKDKLLTNAKFGSTALAITSFAYIAAFRVAQPPGGISELWNWITHHSQDSAFTFSLWHGIRFSLRGTMRLFFGGRVNQVWPDLVTLACAIGFCTILGFLLYYGARAMKEAMAMRPDRILPDLRSWLSGNPPPLLIWIVIYAAFLTFWLPQNTFYRMFYLPPLVFLLVTAPVWRRDRIRILALMAASVCIWNFTASVYPRSKPEANEVLAFAQRHSDAWGPDSTIVYQNFQPDLWVIHYFNPQAVWLSVPAPDVDLLERLRLSAVQNKSSLWVEGTAYDVLAARPAGEQWLREHVDPDRSLLYDTPPHRIRFFRIQ